MHLEFASPQGEGKQNVEATWWVRARLHDRPVFVDDFCMSDFNSLSWVSWADG